MNVGNVMTKRVETVDEQASLTEAARIMREAGVGMLPVLGGGQVKGVLTDRDIVTRAVCFGLDPGSTPVANAMTPQVFHCYADDSIAEAARVMEKRAVRRLVVFDRKKNLVGLISLNDLAVLPGEEERVGRVLDHVVDPGGLGPT